MTSATTTVPKKGPKVDLDATRERLARLGLHHAADRLQEHLSEATKEERPPHRFLDALLDRELAEREERRVKTSLKLSGLPTGQTLGNFDFSFQPSVERSRIETLGTCAWIREKESLLIQGPPGGRQDAPGHRPGRAGHRERLLGGLPAPRGPAGGDEAGREPVAPAASPPQVHERGAARHRRGGLRVDGSRQEASLFFRMISYRYGRGSILITTNKGIRDWPEILAGDEVLATAILDRLLHHSHVLNIKGRSYRLRDLEHATGGRG